ncbi:MAG TPA: hypothetical protein DCG24_07540 [Bacteroidetes bacterium]|nr:hypothetical protein [Bacteroidota bacterium]HAE35162.1 hypothetical protein [Bacteroidota bacterium]
MNRIQHILFFLLFIGSVATAQTTFDAQVSRTQASTADRIELSFTLTNGNKPKNFKAPVMNGLRVLGGPYQSSSFQSINGRTSSSISYKYVVQGSKSGTVTIGSATVEAGGKTYSTKPITLTFTDAPVQADQSDSNGDLQAFLRNNFYLRAVVSDNDVYAGEELTVTYYIYINARSSITDYRLNGATQVPAFDGFYAEDIDVSHVQGEYQTINGQQFLVQPVKKVRLTPQRAGDLLADPMTVDATLSIRKQRSNDSFMDDFFGRGYDRINASATSPSVRIRVRDLPQPAPASFNGAVGSFDMHTTINTTKTTTDEPITYKVEVKGKGNLELFQVPELDLPPGWETYEPEVTSTASSKTYEYLLIPRSAGNFELPPHEWSYFDPKERQYFTLESEGYSIEVEQGKQYSGAGTTKEDVEELNRDIRFIGRSEPHFSKGSGIRVGSPVFATAVGFPFAAGLFTWLFLFWRNRHDDPVARAHKRAGSKALKQLRAAKELSEGDDTKAFCNEAIRVIWQYLGSKWQLPVSRQNKEQITQIFAEKDAPDDLRDETIELLRKLERSIYAPAISGSSSRELFEELESWITHMEKWQA